MKKQDLLNKSVPHSYKTILSYKEYLCRRWIISNLTDAQPLSVCLGSVDPTQMGFFPGCHKDTSTLSWAFFCCHHLETGYVIFSSSSSSFVSSCHSSSQKVHDL